MNRMLIVEKEEAIHKKGLVERIAMDSDAIPLRHPTQYKYFTFARTGERKIDKAK